ncbi:MAG: Serine-pyruvate aminotransferase [Myxococcota bacterium]|nr:Serine-pyruvate aminotransferase [Myxococcota bacterium]
MSKKYLFTPGPTPVPERVSLAMAAPILHHRTKEFESIFAEVRQDLQWIFQTKSDALMFASSGTGAFEGAIASFFSPGDKVISINGGKFGERWTHIGKAYGLNVDEVKVEWGKAVDPAEIRKRLDADPAIKGVFVVASETSTGVANPVRELAELTRNRNTLILVDAITALGVWSIPCDEWGLDVVVTGSQKAFMLPPGLGMAAVSAKAWKSAETAKCPRYYFDYVREKKSQEKNTTAYTPAISLIIGLRESLRMMKEEGLENVFARHDRLARACRAGVKGLGLKLFADEAASSSALTTVVAPEGVDADKIRSHVNKKYGVNFADGQDHLKGKVFRIAHIGYYDRMDVLLALGALEMTLKDLGWNVKLGAGVTAAQAILSE